MRTSDFYNDMMPLLPGVDTEAPGLVDHALMCAVQEFCERTRLYTVDIGIAVTAGEPNVDAPAFPASVIVDVLHAHRSDGEPVTPELVTNLIVRYGDWQARTGPPLHYLLDVEYNMELFPVPVTDDELTVRYALKPAMDATENLPDFLGQRFREEIADGALARMLLMPKKPWTDQPLGVEKRRRFVYACGMGDIKASTGSARINLRTSAAFK